ncbi:MAG: hypothetical protein ACOX4D_03970 [Bacteroidales bacterium]|jgi:hypothetical protein
MKKNLLTLTLILVVLIIPLNLFSQQIKISGEFRPRAEVRSGFQKPLLKSEDPVFAIFQRTRLDVGYESKLFETKISLQDVRVWGQTNHKSAGIPINLFEGWMRFYFLNYSSVTIGRQVIKYDDNRLLSASSWSATGYSHDLILYKYNNKNNNYFLDLGLAYNNSKDVKNSAYYYDNAGSFYKMMNYLWTQKGFKKGLSLSGIFIHELHQDPKMVDNPIVDINNYSRFTTGLNLKLSDKNLPIGFLLSGYYQFGQSTKTYINNGQLQHKDLSAFLLAAKINYFINNNFTFTLGCDLYSGTKYNLEDNNSTNNKSNTWQKLYGSNHSFNGSMEYWRSINDYGLANFYGKFVSHVNNNLSFGLTYHFFSSHQNLSSYEGTSGKYLGSELDLDLSWKFMKYAELTGGWSTYFNSNNTLLVKGMAADADIRFPQWAFISISFKPEFFKSNKLF